MARLTKAQREWRPGMPKKRRSIMILFASTVLSLEAFVVFFGTLAVFGLRRGELPASLILGGGAVLSLVLILTCAVLTQRWGRIAGSLLQLPVIAIGFLEPTMFLIGTAFAITWVYGLRTGHRLDRENAERDRRQAEWERNHPRADPA